MVLSGSVISVEVLPGSSCAIKEQAAGFKSTLAHIENIPN
jgi:hypothetical protein